MPITTLPADPEAMRLDRIRPAGDAITLVVGTVAAQQVAPRCDAK